MILGITGKSGTGKHTAAKFFEQKVWIWRDVVDRFGEEILTKDDVVDRQKLKAIVFGKGPEAEKALKSLNRIVHPELKRVLKDDIYYLKKRKANTVLVAALWDELDLFRLCDAVMLIKAGDALAYERIRKRDGIDFDLFEVTTKNQTEPENAHATVVNESTFQDFYKELNSAITQL
jgi:dephospho-CoA kinase